MSRSAHPSKEGIEFLEHYWAQSWHILHIHMRWVLLFSPFYRWQNCVKKPAHSDHARNPWWGQESTRQLNSRTCVPTGAIQAVAQRSAAGGYCHKAQGQRQAVRRNTPSSCEIRLCFQKKNEYSMKVHVGETCLLVRQTNQWESQLWPHHWEEQPGI